VRWTNLPKIIKISLFGQNYSKIIKKDGRFETQCSRLVVVVVVVAAAGRQIARPTKAKPKTHFHDVSLDGFLKKRPPVIIKVHFGVKVGNQSF